MSHFLESPRVIFSIATVVVLSLATSASPATAQVVAEDFYQRRRAPVGLTAAFGFRTDLVRSAGLDPFSTTDDLTQTALSVGYRLGGKEQAGFAVGAEWNHGSTVAPARAANASLTIDRLTVTLEGRVPVWRRVSAFAKIAPGLLRTEARIFDNSAPGDAFAGPVLGNSFEQTRWVAAADASGGLAVRLAELRGRGSPSFDFWLTAEAGYGYAQSHDLTLSSRAEGRPGRVDEPLRLGQLALQGGFMRARLAISF